MKTIVEVPAKRHVRNLINSGVREIHDKHGKAEFYTLCDGDIQHETDLHDSLKNLKTFSFNFNKSICKEIEDGLSEKLPMRKVARAQAMWGDINSFCRSEAYRIRNKEIAKTQTPRFFWFDYCSLAAANPIDPKKRTYNDFISMMTSSGWSEMAVTEDCQIAVTFKAGARGLLTRGNWLDQTFYIGCQDDARFIWDYNKPRQADRRADFISEIVLNDCTDELEAKGWRCKETVLYRSTTGHMMTIFFDRKKLPSVRKITKI